MELETKHLKVDIEAKETDEIWKKLRKFAIFILFPIHVFFYFAPIYDSQKTFFFSCFLLFAADIVLSFSDLHLLTSKRGRIGIFAHDFLPHLCKKALIAASDFIVFLILDFTQTHGFDIIDTEQFWLFVCITAMVLAALVTFVTGAARTMLFHDDAEKR